MCTIFTRKPEITWKIKILRKHSKWYLIFSIGTQIASLVRSDIIPLEIIKVMFDKLYDDLSDILFLITIEKWTKHE